MSKTKAKAKAGKFWGVAFLFVIAAAIVGGFHLSATLLLFPSTQELSLGLSIFCYIAGVIASGLFMYGMGLWFTLASALHEVEDWPTATESDSHREDSIHFLK